MKQFFIVVFGGLFAVIAGIGIAYAGSVGWRVLKPHFPAVHNFFAPTERSDSTLDTRNDGTSISGGKKTIRYTASEEEDLINAIVGSQKNIFADKITAEAYVMKNLATGEVTVGRDQDRLLPIASLTKLATAVVARKLIDPDVRITIGKNVMATYGNTASFRMGETMTAGDLLYPLLMVSSNDAAEAYALAHGRSKFIKAMNDWAQSIGAYRTSFADASGLSAKNVSTANDLTIILDWIRKNDPTILDITALKTKTVRSHTWVNPTQFLSWSYYLGGKNGYTTEANSTGASLFTLGKNKNIYAIVVLGSSNRNTDVVKLISKVRE